MIKRNRVFALGALAVLIASAVSAYVLLSPRRTWPSAPTYVVDNRGQASITDSDGGLAATINAITGNQAWNGAGAGTVVNATAGNMASFTLGDNIPMLNFEDPTGACNGNCLAATFTGFFSGGTILDADIVTNTAFDWTSASEPDGCFNEFFIEGVQVHEIGHGLGLGHTNVSGATMFPSVSSCNNGPATIEADDIAGILDLYGGGGGGCSLGLKGDPCSSNSECCSGKCRGKSGRKTCK